MPKVSIIIPIYNCENYIKRCIESIINQTLKDIEIIIINDGSTDKSREILETFTDERIQIINQENGGQSKARNYGLSIAKGEYIGFVDCDDWVDLNFFEKLYSSATKNDCDIAMSDFIRKSDKKHKLRLNIKEEMIYESTEDKINVAHAIKEGCIWNKIYKKQLLDGIKFEEGMFFEDGLFTLQALFKSEKMCTVTDTFYYYWVNPNSTVKTLDKKKREDKAKSRRQMLDFINNNNIKIPDRSLWAEKKSYKFFGHKFFTVMESTKSEKYLLFNLIPVFIK